MATDLTDAEFRFDRSAAGMGVPARRVEQPEQLQPALREAIERDGPALVHVALESSVPLPNPELLDWST